MKLTVRTPNLLLFCHESYQPRPITHLVSWPVIDQYREFILNDTTRWNLSSIQSKASNRSPAKFDTGDSWRKCRLLISLRLHRFLREAHRRSWEGFLHSVQHDSVLSTGAPFLASRPRCQSASRLLCRWSISDWPNAASPEFPELIAPQIQRLQINTQYFLPVSDVHVFTHNLLNHLQLARFRKPSL